MKKNLIGLCGAALVGSLGAAPAPEAWSHRQALQPEKKGLVSYPLTAVVLDVAAPDLRDLRLFDAAGREIPFVVERSVRSFLQWENLRFTARLDKNQTVLDAVIPDGASVDALRLDTPADDFLKSTTVEVWESGRWRPLVAQRPVFRRPGIVDDRDVVFPPHRPTRVRLSLDDTKTAAVPVTALWAHRETAPLVGTEPMDAAILRREEGPTDTRWVLTLPARNLFVDRLEVEVSDPLFQRRVRAVVREASNPENPDEGLTEAFLGSATLSRWPGAGGISNAFLSLPIGRGVPERELELVVSDGDNPPLTVTAVRAHVVPTRVLFFSENGEAVFLAVGNRQALPPRYDVEHLRGALAKTPLGVVAGGPLEPNPGHRAPEVLPEVPDTAAPFDATGWSYRAPVSVTGPGVQRLVLPPAVLSRCLDQGRDLRLVWDGRQVPFVYDRRPVYQTWPVSLRTLADGPAGISRWEVLLPNPRWPLSHLEVRAAETFFTRAVRLYEERSGPGGETVRRPLAQGQWVRTSDRSPRLLLALQGTPEDRRLILEVENGDNAPLTLEDARATVKTFALLFKTKPPRLPMLYYGNPRAAFPRYDLALAAPILLTADKGEAVIGAEDVVSPRRRVWFGGNGQTGPVFWVVLALAVAAVGTIIGRLLPAEKDPPSDGAGKK